MKELGKPSPDSDVVNSEPKVLIIGYGWVGQYIGKYFKNAHYTDETNLIRQVKDDEITSIDEYDLAVICVPTPMDEETGRCDTSIVEQVIQRYRDCVDYFLIKSTVEIGTTDYLKNKYDIKVTMSPEYIGETLGHPLTEAKRDAFQIIGGEEATTRKIAEFWRLVLHANAPIIQVTAKEAEAIKYLENYWIMKRVSYWNDVYSVCKTFDLNFEKVRNGLVQDPRLDRTHSNVYPDNRGWSGKCLPKDMNALAWVMREKDTPLESLEFEIDKNTKVRSQYKDSNKLKPERPQW